MPRPFHETLASLRHGGVADELAERLTELVAAVRATGRAGELVLKLKVAPASRGDTRTLMLTDAITAKLPKAERAASVFFADDHNALHRNDPRQPELGLRAVPDPETKPLREAQP